MQSPLKAPTKIFPDSNISVLISEGSTSTQQCRQRLITTCHRVIYEVVNFSMLTPFFYCKEVVVGR